MLPVVRVRKKVVMWYGPAESLISPPSNMHVALMNDAFNESAKEGGIGYWKLVSEVIAGKFPDSTRQGR